MIEYEYSFKVTDVVPFISFCKEHGYEKENVILQTRILYKHANKILARITINEVGKVNTKYFDFKEENESDKVLKESKESPMLEINDNNKEFVNSILEIFDFKQSKELKRTRYIYKKDSIKFEIDDYSQPEMKVVAIEGEKAQVDKAYKEIERLYQSYKI